MTTVHDLAELPATVSPNPCDHVTKMILATRVASICRLAVLTAAVHSLPLGAQAAVTVGATAPQFTIRNHKTGQSLSLAQYQGSVVVLDFWACWCGACQLAAEDLEPNIADFYRKNGGNRNGVPVTVIAVSVDGRYPTEVNNFIATYGLELVGDDTANVYSKYGNGYIPYFVVINAATNSTNHKPWEVLYSASGYNRSAIKAQIDAVQTPAPICRLTTPTPGTALTCSAITLSAEVTDNGKIIKQVQFYSGSTLIGTRTNAPYTLVWTNSAPGTRTVFARACYGTSAKVDSAPVTLTVAAPTPVAANLTPSGDDLELHWVGGAGPYQVQVTADLLARAWTNVGAASVATNLTLSPTNKNAFYRVLHP